MTGPSNDEFFRFLETELSFSFFRRSGEALISFKETIEFILLPESTVEGPEEGLLLEGVTPMSAVDWRELVASFVMSMAEHRVDPGSGRATRVFRATKPVGDRMHLSLEPAAGAARDCDDAPIREELRAEDSCYVWTCPSTQPGAVGRLMVHARRIACRGSDKGMPARLIFSNKLRQYRERQRDMTA